MPEAAPVSGRRATRSPCPPLLLALTTAALLWLCYFPVAWGWLAWVALVPYLALVRSPARARTLYLCAWAGGLAVYWPLLQWLRVADPRMFYTWAFLATYCALYLPAALWLLRFFDRRTGLPLVLTVPAVWTALEFFRVHFGTGFSWYLLAHTQHDFLHLIQVADVTGAYGVTFLVAAVNALVFELLYALPAVRSRLVSPAATPRGGRRALFSQGAVVLTLLVAAFAYGAWRLGQDTQTPGPRVALIQGNLDQRIRNESVTAADAADVMEQHYIYLCDLVAPYRPDLIVWPETSYPGYWEEGSDGGPLPGSQRQADAMARRWQTPLLLGMNARVFGPWPHPRLYNSAILIDAHGRRLGRYDKFHRVPFGEYVPLRDWLPWMNKLAPYDFEYSVWPGEEHTRFPLKTAGRSYTFGAIICYEDTDPDVSRPYGGGDGLPPADFVVNISNDGWFQGTSEHDEHLAICRFRAVEDRRSVVRAVNMGVSAVIDGNGRVLEPHPLPEQTGPRAEGLRKLLGRSLAGDARVWEVGEGQGGGSLPSARWAEYKKVSGVLLATVPIDRRGSFYARWGDWLPWACWLLVLGGLVAGRLRRKPASHEDAS